MTGVGGSNCAVVDVQVPDCCLWLLVSGDHCIHFLAHADLLLVEPALALGLSDGIQSHCACVAIGRGQFGCGWVPLMC